jgi:hypothetical protein
LSNPACQHDPDGNRSDGRYAHYLLLDPAQLVIEG